MVATSHQTYASVVCLESFHIVMAIVAAFLYSTNKFTTYMCQPLGFVTQGEQNKVLQVIKTLFGMMQGGYDFQGKMSSTYGLLGYYKLLADPCVHSHVIENEFTLTSTYTDNIFHTSSTKEGAEKAKTEFEACFEIKDVGELGYILGICVEKDDSTSLSQEAYL